MEFSSANLVEEVLEELAHAQIAPLAMDQKQLFQELELGNAKVAAVDGLPALEATDADANVGGLDHADVVGAVADGQRAGLVLLLDERHHLGLLQR